MKHHTDTLPKQFDHEAILTDADRDLMKSYADALSQVVPEAAFVNVIRYGNRCGFAMAGSEAYLLNTNAGASYHVTLRINWRCGIEYGDSEQVVVIPAGGKKSLGCTDSGYVPVTYYTFSVIGEVQI